MIKKVTVVAGLLWFLSVSTGMAETICFQWIPNTDSITHYTIYQDTRSNKFIEEISVDSDIACTELNDKLSHKYFMTASNEDGESNNSNVIVYHPIDPNPEAVRQPPTAPGNIHVSVSVNVETSN